MVSDIMAHGAPPKGRGYVASLCEKFFQKIAQSNFFHNFAKIYLRSSANELQQHKY
jgi:hypothetical protein